MASEGGVREGAVISLVLGLEATPGTWLAACTSFLRTQDTKAPLLLWLPSLLYPQAAICPLQHLSTPCLHGNVTATEFMALVEERGKKDRGRRACSHSVHVPFLSSVGLTGQGSARRGQS
jgi:hypothetical protein